MKNVSYKSSGVDIDKANAFVSLIQKSVGRATHSQLLRRKGAFGGLFSFNAKKYRDPVLVSSTDGVGTKLLIAKAAKRHDTIGVDLVAMNVNDILCVGAVPLFFLDYIACGKINQKVLKGVVKGVLKGCSLSGCVLAGGETAEMPGVYGKEDYDLAGFAVGVVERSKIIDGSRIKKGDVVLGLPSSGIHSNGYSLVRHVLSLKEQKKLYKELLKPTRIYAKELLPVIKKFNVTGLAHMTGGAYYEKLTKILPDGLSFSIDISSWPVPKIFQIIQKKGKIKQSEMYRTFNMGVGMAIVASEKEAAKISSFLKKNRFRHYRIGRAVKSDGNKLLLS